MPKRGGLGVRQFRHAPSAMGWPISQEPTQRIDAGVAGALVIVRGCDEVVGFVVVRRLELGRGLMPSRTMQLRGGLRCRCGRFIATSVGFDVLGGMMARIDGLAGRVVSGATGFEQDGGSPWSAKNFANLGRESRCRFETMRCW